MLRLFVVVAALSFSLPVLADAAPFPSEVACQGKAAGDDCHYRCLDDCSSAPNDGVTCSQGGCTDPEKAIGDICGSCANATCADISACEGEGEGEGGEGEGATCACVTPSTSSPWSLGHAFSGACVVAAGVVFVSRRRRR